MIGAAVATDAVLDRIDAGGCSLGPLGAFPPTRGAALARIDAICPADYARSRNAIDGAVTRLSPYITHGIVSLPEVLAGVAARHPLALRSKLVLELGWREYFQHVWRHRGDGILRSLHPGPLPDGAYAHTMPDDVREARTGVPAIDQAVRALHTSGYLHNHARLWLASYLVHLRKVHWRTGADWMLGLLLDGDLASNHLSWQWVAGTGSHQPYVFNADNVARHAPPSWHSTGTAIDAGYDAMDALARHTDAVAADPRGDGVAEPARSSAPPCRTATSLCAEDLAGRDVWLVHPWALGEPPADLPAGHLVLGWWPAEHHAAWPWSGARWAFVGTRMTTLAPHSLFGGRPALARLLAQARTVQTAAHPNVDRFLPDGVQRRPPQLLFAEVDHPCASFSAWWGRSTRGLQQLEDLPGLIAIASR